MTSMTLEQVGRALGVTPGRVRQIEATALRKLRHATRAHLIDCFVDPENYWINESDGAGNRRHLPKRRCP